MIKSKLSLSPRTPRETGQAIVIIALGFVVLLGFTGLVVDVARVFVARGNLRRAVDSAGLAAAAQFRQNAPVANITTSATQFIYAHGIVNDPSTFADMSVITSTIRVESCETTPALNASFCNTLPRRKLVRINAAADVSMSFLQIVGIRTVQVAAESVSEAAAVDVVLVIDASLAQAYDPPSMAAYNGRIDLACDPTSLGIVGLDAGTTQNACAAACNQDPSRPCYPFKKVKDAAKAFIDTLYQNYDRVAVVRIDREPEVVFPLSTDLAGAKAAIDDPNRMYVSDRFPGYAHGDPCPTINVGGERWKCTTSNMGGALIIAGDQFRTPPFRDDSLWVIVLLGSGSGDATDNNIPSIDPDTTLFGFCPGKDAQPFCRDNQWATHHISTSVQYDAEDYAYDKANYLGALPDRSYPSLGIPGGGAGILMFTIGLGRKVVCTGAYTTYNGGPPVVCTPSAGSPFIDPGTGYPNGAESFLRYVAAIGDDGDPTTDPCKPGGVPAALGVQCGNYYFAPDADQLQRIFLTIAGKIFTRLAG